jgi:hypothetical protein
LAFSDYEQLGGLLGAVAYRANELLKSNGADEGLVSEFYELFVGQGQESGPFIKSVPIVLIELARPPLRKIIQKFIDSNLLVHIESHEHKPALVLVHDRLLDEWTELKEWIEKSSDYLLWRNKIEQDFYSWQMAINIDEDNGVDIGTEQNHYYWMYVYLKLWVKLDSEIWQKKWQVYIDRKIVNAKESSKDFIDKTSCKSVMANVIREGVQGNFHRDACADKFLLRNVSLINDRGMFPNVSPLLKRYLKRSMMELYFKPIGLLIISA